MSIAFETTLMPGTFAVDPLKSRSHAYSDRSTPYAQVAIWPYKRFFQTAMADEDLTDDFSTVTYTPGFDASDDLYVNMGAVDRDFFTPAQRVKAGH